MRIAATAPPHPPSRAEGNFWSQTGQEGKECAGRGPSGIRRQIDRPKGQTGGFVATKWGDGDQRPRGVGGGVGVANWTGSEAVASHKQTSDLSASEEGGWGAAPWAALATGRRGAARCGRSAATGGWRAAGWPAWRGRCGAGGRSPGGGGGSRRQGATRATEGGGDRAAAGGAWAVLRGGVAAEGVREQHVRRDQPGGRPWPAGLPRESFPPKKIKSPTRME